MRNIAPILMSLLFLAILVGANIYLSRRVAWIFSLDSRTWLHILFAVLPVFMVGGMVGFSNSTSLAGTILYGTAAIVTGLVLYLLLAFLVTDLLRLFVPLKPALFGVIAFSLAVGVTAYGLWNATRTQVTRLEVAVGEPQQPGGEIRPGTRQETRIGNQSADLPENRNTDPAETRNSTRIMHLSDIHLGHFRGKAFLSRLVELTAAESPDLVVITGDLFDGRRQLHSETLEPLKKLDVPLFFVEGNHDGYTGVERVKALVRGAGVRVLENEVVDAGGLQLVGLNHMPADDGAPSMHAGENKGTIRAVLDTLEIDPALPSVLLHHSPDGIEFAVKKGIGLYLAGHTHGGQLFPVNFINDLLFQFNRGLTNHNGTRIFVSKGAGTFGPPLRVGTRGEITLIELKTVHDEAMTDKGNNADDHLSAVDRNASDRGCASDEAMASTDIITVDDLKGLPAPVAGWLKKTGIVGTPRVHRVWVSQESEMRLSPEKDRWNRAISEQVFDVDEPAFTWKVKMKMGPFNLVRGVDEFSRGKGHMTIRLLNLFPVVDAGGPKIDEGSIQRFLGEMVWFPAAALNSYITWEAVDRYTARAVIESHGTRGEGTFHFNEEGDFVRFSAMRFRGNEADSKRYEWVIDVKDYATFEGIRLPSQMEATWKLEEGDWTWLKMRVTEIRYC